MLEALKLPDQVKQAINILKNDFGRQIVEKDRDIGDLRKENVERDRREFASEKASEKRE